MDGLWVFLGAGAALGALGGLAVLAPAIIPRLFAGKNDDAADPGRLQATVSVYDQLDHTARKRLQKQTAIFLKRKKLRADGGKLPPIMASAIAGNACLLRLQPNADCYPDLHEVRLSEGPTRVTGKHMELNWSEVQNSIGSKRNAVIRAFAQILHDTPAGSSKNRSGARYPEKWQRQFRLVAGEIKCEQSPIFAAHEEQAEQDLFLSACEAYFQCGDELAGHHPALYELLREYFVVGSAAHPA